MTEALHAPQPFELVEAFLAEAISNSPQPLKDLAEFLSNALSEDDWKTADRLLLALALRTQAPDSWRPTEQEVETVLRCCDAMERSVERKGLPKSEADICVATDWLRKVCAALRPQTAESGK